jgi:hypothetical protein
MSYKAVVVLLLMVSSQGIAKKVHEQATGGFKQPQIYNPKYEWGPNNHFCYQVLGNERHIVAPVEKA